MISTRLQSLKKYSLPLILAVSALFVDGYLASVGPYFHWPHWSAIVFPPLAVMAFTLAIFYLGGLLGALGTYLLFSFFILEIVLAVVIGSLSDDLITACAASNAFHHFKLQLLIWTFLGIVFCFTAKSLFKRNFITSIRFFSLALVLLLINIPLSFYFTRCKIRISFAPKIQIGISHGPEKLTPLLTPNVLSQIAYETRHAYPGAIGDLMALVAFANDSGADMLPRAMHPLPKTFQPSPQTQVQNIVLIMGESSASSHYHAYGYNVETTPELDKILSQGNACKIDKVHSAANQTRDAVLPSISLWFPEDAHQGMDQANLIEIATKQGYKTYWASTEIERGAYSGFIGYVGQYSDAYINPTIRNAAFEGTNFFFNEQDESLLPLFEYFSSRKEAAKKKFIFLHLWGSHLPYGEKTRQEDIDALPNASRYDQTIHRTDRILGQIIQTAKKNLDHPLIIYLPDHGEDPENTGGHGLKFGGKDYIIPLILIGDKAKENCAYIEKLRADNGWYSSNMNKFLILRLLGLNPDYDWVEAQRNPDLVLHVGGKIYPWGKIPEQHLND